ncbi:MAG: isoprenylcysteine carboxyl methyltransferase family protein, partial [Vicinamibacteria bacterium]
VEHGRDHFLAMKLLHTGFFVSCALEVILLDRPFLQWLGFPMLGIALAAQGLRYWAIGSLGRRWNARVIAIPGMPLVASGPYRFMRHPNYLAVALEGIAIPLVHTAVFTAIGFTLLNAWILRVRIRCEEKALAP